MIHIPGRKPYDPSIPRTVLDSSGVKDRQISYDESRVSIQSFINGDNGHIVPERYEAYIKKLISRGFTKLEPDSIYDLYPGLRMAYVTYDNRWRSGGFVLSVHDSCTEYGEKEEDIDITEKEYKPYILYKGFNNAVFSLQESDVKEFWIKDTLNKPKENKNEVIIFKIPKYETNYPVLLLNNNGENVIVYYARDNYARNRFINTQKFQKALSGSWMFEDGTQGEDFEIIEFTPDTAIETVNLVE